MLPFFAPLADVDGTLRASVLQSVQASMLQAGTGAVLLGGDLALDGRADGARSLYVGSLHAEGARAIDVAVQQGFGAPTVDFDADATLSATWITSPRAGLSLESDASLATTYGLRASDALLELDPFTYGQRVDAIGGADLTYERAASSRSTVAGSVGYVAEGAPAADTKSAVGMDTQEVDSDVSFSYDLGPRDTLTQGARYAYTHFYHALLDSQFRRGRADINTASVYGTFSQLSSGRHLRPLFGGGVSVGSPMPIVHDTRVVAAPDAGLSFTYANQGRA